MIHLHQTYEILTGGFYTENCSWNKKRTEIDNCFKIYQLTEGEVYICNEEQEFILEKDRIYFINGSKFSHQYCRQSFSTHWLHFIPKDLVVYQGLLSLPLIVDLSDEKNGQFHRMFDTERLQSLNFTSYQEYTLELLKAQTFIQSSVIALLEKYPLENNKHIPDTQRVQPAIQYINDHFTEPIRLEQLANLCCMSPNYFHKIFTQTLNSTPANYITLLRMNTALQQLINNKCTIKEIAYELGFTDDAYFSRVFKKYYGITPGDYKQKRKEILF